MSYRQKQVWGLFSAFALMFLLMIPAQSQGPPPPPPPPHPGGKGIVGKISAVSSSSVTVQTREGDSQTYTISSSATISLDDQTVKASSLATGQFVVLTSTDGKTATDVDAHTGPPPGGPPPDGGPPPGGPPPDGGPPPGGPPPDGPPPGMGPPPDGPPPPGQGPPPDMGPPPF